MSYEQREKIKTAVEEIIDGKKSDFELNKKLDFVLKSVYDYSIKGREEKSEAENENRNYPYIPWSRTGFVKLIREIQKKEKRKHFIDVGCGIGDKALLAYLFGDFEKVSGIELNETTYHVAKYFLGNGSFDFEDYGKYIDNDYDSRKDSLKPPKREKVKRNIIFGDAFDLNYVDYDFIYMYVPINNNRIMRKLYKKVLLEMPINGIVTDVSFSQGLEREVRGIDKNPEKIRGGYRYYIKKIGKNKFRIVNLKRGK